LKTLGLIGGMSWESSAVYYRRLNEITRERLGGQHSARLLLLSVDFAPIAAMQAEGRWDEASAAMVSAARTLEAAGADALVICANTMHLMADDVAAAVGVPLIHVADVTAAALAAAGVRRALLLATAYTMEKAFYRDRLAAGGVETVIPPDTDRGRLHAIIFDELVRGRFEAGSKAAVAQMIRDAAVRDGVEAVIFGCTEIGMLLPTAESPLPAYDTLELHAAAAMDFALSPAGAARR
jgi:aspartate racemase